VKEERVRKKVREGYARIAVRQVSCCGSSTIDEACKRMGYTEEELRSASKSANLALGCGNPVALASLRKGETVVDLGSGGGFDCFLAAKRVGDKGRVVGVDMTPEMIDKARHNAQKGKYKNVEFRLGEIENLPVADNAADVVISNCVINLTPNKRRVFEEAYRVLKPGGRLLVSDIVLLKGLSEIVKKRAHPASCLQGAIMRDRYVETIGQAGFHDVRVVEEKLHSSGDFAVDPNAKVVVFDAKKNIEELKSVSELDEEAREVAKEAAVATASISVSAVKPSQ
jgi:arsenite methyltransferase